jgi:hypothetical protein
MKKSLHEELMVLSKEIRNIEGDIYFWQTYRKAVKWDAISRIIDTTEKLKVFCAIETLKIGRNYRGASKEKS